MNKITKHETKAVAQNVATSPKGLEHVTHQDLKLPIIKVISNMSDKTLLAKGKPGDIYNDVSDRLYKSAEGFLAVPCMTMTTYNEWAPRGTGSGRPVQIHKDRSVLKNCTRDPRDNRDYLPANSTGQRNYVEETGNHFIYILDKDYNPVEPALIPMKSTQRKKSRLWTTKMSQLKIKLNGAFITPDTFRTAYRLTTVEDGNDKGTWYSWQIAFDSILKNEATINVCENFYESIASNSDMFTDVKFEENMSNEEPRVAQPQAGNVASIQTKDDDVF